ncbi:MAG TPA: TolC family outer membrane protein [Coxiellaceae bacterium]|nr:TolC family outer membrane protein [Coxiellaceae bacterium]
MGNRIQYLARLAVLSLSTAVFSAHADDLMQVYHQALQSDPTYKEAYATWLANKQTFPIAFSQYLPQLDLTGAVAHTNTKVGSAASSNANTNAYTLTLTQPIIDFATIFSIAGARYDVKQAAATYSAAGQDLLQRTATGYFNVLKAAAELRYTLAEERALLKQLETAREKFKVGLIAITAVYQAQATYDSTVATEISDRNNLENALEDLTAITGARYQSLQGIGKDIPLITPNPQNINAWVQTAQDNNLALKAQEFATLEAQQNIRQQFSGHLPTVEATASYGSAGTNSTGSMVYTKTGTVGLSANLPLLEGGNVVFSTLQAQHQYQAAVANRELQYRTAVNNTRKDYLGIVAGISQIKADAQAIVSARNSLTATQAGYTVGTETMEDVLNNLSELYAAQRQYADDQYTYMASIISLKEDAGTLSPTDLEELNGWLKSSVTFTDTSPSGNQLSSVVMKPSEKAKTLPSQSSSKGPTQSLLNNATGLYTLQLYAANNAERANVFMHHLFSQPGVSSDLLHVFSIKQKGVTVYKVGYGHFVSPQQAQKALASLSSVLKQYKPWIVKTPG